MKKVLLVGTMLLLSIIGFGQEYTKRFFSDGRLCKGLYLKFDSTKLWNPVSLYSSPPENIYSSKDLFLPDKNKMHTDNSFFSGKEFFVADVIKLKDYEHTDYSVFKLYIFETCGVNCLYYLYDNTRDFPFFTKGLINENNYINLLKEKIEKNVDEFTGEIQFNTPYVNNIIIYKYIKNSVTTYYLSLVSYSSSLSINKNGVIILFDDGTKWEKLSEEIDVNVSDGNWRYSAFIKLTNQDLITFSKKNITKYRLYIYDNSVKINTKDYFKVIMGVN